MTEFLKLIEIPALLLAGILVCLQQRTIERLTKQLENMNGTLSKLSAVVDLICSKILFGGKPK